MEEDQTTKDLEYFKYMSCLKELILLTIILSLTLGIACQAQKEDIIVKTSF